MKIQNVQIQEKRFSVTLKKSECPDSRKTLKLYLMVLAILVRRRPVFGPAVLRLRLLDAILLLLLEKGIVHGGGGLRLAVGGGHVARCGGGVRVVSGEGKDGLAWKRR